MAFFLLISFLSAEVHHPGEGVAVLKLLLRDPHSNRIRAHELPRIRRIGRLGLWLLALVLVWAALSLYGLFTGLLEVL